MGVNNKLREIRMQEYLIDSKKEFAKLLDINYRQYSEYERGTVPNSETMLKIAKKLNKPVEDIFYLVD